MRDAGSGLTALRFQRTISDRLNEKEEKLVFGDGVTIVVLLAAAEVLIHTRLASIRVAARVQSTWNSLCFGS
jgi:hypothetical protein